MWFGLLMLCVGFSLGIATMAICVAAKQGDMIHREKYNRYIAQELKNARLKE